MYARKDIAVEVAFRGGKNDGKTKGVLFAADACGDKSAFSFYLIEITLPFEGRGRPSDGNSACTEFCRELLFARKFCAASLAFVGGKNELQEIIFDLFV